MSGVEKAKKLLKVGDVISLVFITGIAIYSGVYVIFLSEMTEFGATMLAGFFTFLVSTPPVLLWFALTLGVRRKINLYQKGVVKSHELW